MMILRHGEDNLIVARIPFGKPIDGETHYEIYLMTSQATELVRNGQAKWEDRQ